MHDKKSMVRLSNDLRDKIIVTNGALNYYIWPQKKKKKEVIFNKKFYSQVDGIGKGFLLGSLKAHSEVWDNFWQLKAL